MLPKQPLTDVSLNRTMIGWRKEFFYMRDIIIYIKTRIISNNVATEIKRLQKNMISYQTFCKRITLKTQVFWINCYETFKPPVVQTQAKNYSDASF